MADARREYGPTDRPLAGDGLQSQSTGELLKEFFNEGQILLKEEIRLAKLEAKAEAKKTAKAGALAGAGGVLLHTALLVFAAFLVAVGWTFLPLWVSALIVFVLFAIVGGVALMLGKNRIEKVEPDRPVRSFKEDREWASDTMRSIRSHRHANA